MLFTETIYSLWIWFYVVGLVKWMDKWWYASIFHYSLDKQLREIIRLHQLVRTLILYRYYKCRLSIVSADVTFTWHAWNRKLCKILFLSIWPYSELYYFLQFQPFSYLRDWSCFIWFRGNEFLVCTWTREINCLTALFSPVQLTFRHPLTYFSCL